MAFAAVREELAEVRQSLSQTCDDSQCEDDAERDQAVKKMLDIRDKEKELLDQKRDAIYQSSMDEKRNIVLQASQETSDAIGEIMRQLQVLQDAQLETAEVALSLLP